MKKLLSRGLNFCVTPKKVNITEALVDLDKFARKVRWKEHYADDEQNDDWKKQLFRKDKATVPTDTSKTLLAYLSGIRSEFIGTSLNKTFPNIPTDEAEALVELIDLQKNRIIVIKPCDKGAGIIICNFSDYIESCTAHLNSKTEKTNENYYKIIDSQHVEKLTTDIQHTLDEVKTLKILSEDEFEAMSPHGKGPGKFYQTFKIHKSHDPPKLPPGRPIVSGCNSITENISLYVDHHSKSLVPLMPSYIQDTPDFLRKLEALKVTKLPSNTVPITIDVTGLYTNIPHEQGLETLRQALDTREDKTVPTDFLIKLMHHVLSANTFEFNSKLYLQLIGTAMGTRAAPTFSNLYMASIDILIQAVADSIAYGLIQFYCRFIDDIFTLWTGTKEQFDEFMLKIDQIHPNLAFTASHNFLEKSTNFLDLTVRIVNDTIVTDLYRKPTDRVQYLLPSSCHPLHTFKSIPYSLALRLVRICSQPRDLEKRFTELAQMLKSRDYNTNVVNAAIEKARNVGRQEALKKMEKKENDIITLAITYHPALPAVSNILTKHWKTLTRDQKMRDIFPKPPMVAYRQPKNLKKQLVHAKVQGTTRPQRIIPGMKRCKKSCKICSYITQTKETISTQTNEKFPITGDFSCQTAGVVYLITCLKCNLQYVGQSKRKFKDRIANHLYYIDQKREATGKHFTSPGHAKSDLRCHIIEKVSPSTPHFLIEREDFWIRKLVTKHPDGLNRNQIL